MTFLEQALEVTVDEAEQADILERAGDAAIASAHQKHAEELLVRAQAIRERLGDRVGLARAITLRARAMFMIPRRDAAISLGESGRQLFEDMPDEPAVVDLVTGLASAYTSMGDYKKGGDAARRALAAAERLGKAQLAAMNLNTLSSIAFYEGRLWEARALGEGALHLAREHDLKDIELTINNNLTSILALDDPRATIEIERDTIALARRLGMRTRESVVLGNASEDARRTGEWDWAVEEIQATRGNDMDPPTRWLLDAALFFYRLLRDEVTEGELETVLATAQDIQDRDVSSGLHDLLAQQAAVHGDWSAAVASWREQAAMSDLNKPYALPRAGYAAVMGGDEAAAQDVLDELAVLGTRGRAIETDQAQIRAGIAALRGDEAASLAGYRAALAAYRDLGLVWDEALLGMAAGTRLGGGHTEVRGWLETARDTMTRLRARPFAAMVTALLEEPAATNLPGAAEPTIAQVGDQPSASLSGAVVAGS